MICIKIKLAARHITGVAWPLCEGALPGGDPDGVTERRTTTVAAILTEEWLPDSVELTPTMKLKRRPIAQKYASQIEALYTTKETK
jgi:hypothetical protein